MKNNSKKNLIGSAIFFSSLLTISAQSAEDICLGKTAIQGYCDNKTNLVVNSAYKMTACQIKSKSGNNLVINLTNNEVNLLMPVENDQQSGAAGNDTICTHKNLTTISTVASGGGDDEIEIGSYHISDRTGLVSMTIDCGEGKDAVSLPPLPPAGSKYTIETLGCESVNYRNK